MVEVDMGTIFGKTDREDDPDPDADEEDEEDNAGDTGSGVFLFNEIPLSGDAATTGFVGNGKNGFCLGQGIDIEGMEEKGDGCNIGPDMGIDMGRIKNTFGFGKE